ncbi:MAG: ABC transporter substrate-binding protein [Gammaproteobacteria bacterium]|nr:ABC transporter substrate-binding protein [Gammaproteobacteria bacterium]
MYLIFVFWLAACVRPETDVLRFGLSSSPVTLDPRFATDATSSRINRLIYRRLVEFDGSFTPIPSLADWQRITEQHYRFTLKTQGRDFHHGKRLNAVDVKATYDYILAKNNASPHRATLALIARIETPDENTIDFFLNKADPLFPGYLVIGILPAKLIQQGHTFNRQPIGSGPFEFSKWPEDSRVMLSRLRDKQKLEFIRIPNPTVRVLKLLRGELDMIQNDLPPELITYLAKRSDIKIIKGEGSNFTYLGFNMDDPLVGNHAIREAIAYALDRESIIKYVMGGAARPASAMLIPDHWAGNPGLALLEYNPEKAKMLLANAGYDTSNPVKITYKTSSDPFRIRLATVIQSQLAKVGINVDIRSYDWGTFYGDIKSGQFQMYSLSWIGIKTPDIFQYVFHSESVPPNGANRGHYANPVADKLIKVAQQAGNLDAMAVSYKMLQSHLLETLPYVPLWYEDHVFVSRSDLEGYTVAIDGNYDALVDVQRRIRSN